MTRLTDEIWKSPVLQQRFQQEARFDTERRGRASRPQFCVAVPENVETRRGAKVLQNYETSIINEDPHPAQCALAATILDGLNRQHHHDGIWVVGWTHPPDFGQSVREDGDNCWGRLIMLWLDEDADPQFTAESDLDFVNMIEAGEHYYVNMGAESWAKWDEAYGKRARKEDFALKEHESRREVLESLR